MRQVGVHIEPGDPLEQRRDDCGPFRSAVVVQRASSFERHRRASAWSRRAALSGHSWRGVLASVLSVNGSFEGPSNIALEPTAETNRYLSRYGRTSAAAQRVPLDGYGKIRSLCIARSKIRPSSWRLATLASQPEELGAPSSGWVVQYGGVGTHRHGGLEQRRAAGRPFVTSECWGGRSSCDRRSDRSAWR